MTEIPKENIAETIRDLVQHYCDAKIVKVKGQDGIPTELLILPEHLKAHSVKQYLDVYLENPERRKGTAHLKDIDSLIAHVNRFKGAPSALFANNSPSSPSITAVIDYHEESHEGTPRYGEHRSHYAFSLSDEWNAWGQHQNKRMSQADFAEFLENHISDVISPDNADDKLREFSELLGGTFASPSRLVELSRGLQVNEGARVEQKVNISSGEATLHYTSTHADANGAPLKVPNLFLLGIPVFRCGPLYQVPVRLRYRIISGSIQWFYELYRTDRVFDHAFKEACEKAQKETGLPLFIGSPEA